MKIIKKNPEISISFGLISCLIDSEYVIPEDYWK